MKKDDSRARTQRYRERLREKQEAAAEKAEERSKCEARNLSSFGEIGFETPAQTCLEEIQIHRASLRVLGQPDIQEGETLRQLAKRTWDALLNAKSIGVFVSGHDMWLPLFNPRLQQFDDWYGYEIKDAAKPDWFETHWVPPEGTGDEVIPIDNLPNLPPIKFAA